MLRLDVLCFSVALTAAAPFAYGAPPPADTADACTSFLALIKQTYTFKPSKLVGPERKEKIAAMDKVWDTAKKDPSHLAPCLRTALADSSAQSWFLLDGSQLLLQLDHSKAAKEIYVRNWNRADLEDADARVFVESLAQLAAEGFDTSEGALNLLSHPGRSYNLPAHAIVISPAAAATFLIGSMEEAQARAVLNKVLANSQNPRRSEAAILLTNLETPEAVRDLKKLDLQGFAKDTQEYIKAYLARREPPLKPSQSPQLSRQEIVAAFSGAVDGNEKGSQATQAIVKQPQWRADAAAVLTPADVAILRRLRRYVAARGNPHLIETYRGLSQVIATLDAKPLAQAR